MARLVVKSDGSQPAQVIELRLGVNRFGRSQLCDFQLLSPTVSGLHCEVVLGDDGIIVRDCNSTNGTFIGGKKITTERLHGGETLRLGEIELLCETAEVTIAIPKVDTPHGAPPPVVRSDGSLLCPRHPDATATYQCTACREVMCDECVHRIGRRGGGALLCCPVCSNKCVPLAGEKPRKRSIFGKLQKTIRLPFARERKRR